MRILLTMAAAIPLVAASAVATAQSNTTDYGRPADTPENRTDGALRRAASCVNNRVPNSARKVLETPIASKDESKRAKALLGVARECFGLGWPDFQPTAFRNALAESAYRASYMLRDPAPRGSGPKNLPASFGVAPAGQEGTPEQQAAWQLAAIARCVVFVGPEDSRQLILGPRNVPEEERRFALLRAAMEQCIGADSAGLLTARTFRGFVASALIERVNAAK